MIKHNGLLKIATGESRHTKVWTNVEIDWNSLIDKLQKPARTQETYERYINLNKRLRDDLKDVGGFVGGYLDKGRRRSASVVNRTLLTLDIDNLSGTIDIWPLVRLAVGGAVLLYSTRSHSTKKPRLRLVAPLARAVSPEEYEAIARKIASVIGLEIFDPTTFEPSRLMYWPSCSVDSDYYFRVEDDEFLDPDEILARYVNWRDVTAWPGSQRHVKELHKKMVAQGQPQEKPGLIGAFCRAYNIDGAIENFIQEAYKPAGEGRYTYAEGSTSGGLVLYNDGNFAFSHHGTDPASGRLVNAFDLVRLHKFGVLDEDVDTNEVPVNKLPSYIAMCDFAGKDSSVKSEILKDTIADFDDNEDGLDWIESLELNKKGSIAATINNIVIILLNDKRISESYYYDVFRNRAVIMNDLPWQKIKGRENTDWTDADDAGLRNFLEQEYNITAVAKTDDALKIAMLSKERNPVKEYLESLVWDGSSRVDSLFIDKLGADDNKYIRAVTRASLIGAVARILEPGCKHDSMVVLVGPQGCGKSTLLASLGGEWFSDSLYTMTGKDAYEQLQGAWIIEISEMAATKKSDVEQIKHFISKRTDTYRAAFGKRTQSHPRTCAFFGSTNDTEFLRDSTGGRRFWPVVVKENNVNTILDSNEVKQIWAEVMWAYKNGEPWHLSLEIEKIAREEQARHTEQSSKQGVVETFVNRKITKDWLNKSLEDRMLFWTADFIDDENEVLVEREHVCALELWVECFNGDMRGFKQAQARELNDIMRKLKGWTYTASKNCGAIYGRQRAFVRTK